MPVSRRPTYAAPAAACAADILRLLTRSKDPLSLTEFERGLTRSKSLIFRALRELETQEFISRDDTGRYRLAVAAVELGAAYLHQLSMLEASAQVLRAIATDTGDAVNLGVLSGAEVLYLMHYQGAATYVTISRVGGRVPASCLAIGKALLATCTDDDIRSRFSDPLPQITPKSVQTVDRLLREVTQIRNVGFAEEHDQIVLGRSALAVTARLDGFPAGIVGLSISTVSAEMTRRRHLLLAQLQHAKEVLERDRLARASFTVAGVTAA